MPVLESFEQWKQFLGNKVDKAQAVGMSKEQIADAATRIGSYLANNVDAKNKQEQLLAEMWRVSNPNQQHALAEIMVQLVGD